MHALRSATLTAVTVALSTLLVVGALASFGVAPVAPQLRRQKTPVARVRRNSAGCLAAQVGVFVVLGSTRGGGKRWRRFTATVAPVFAVLVVLGPTVPLLAWVPVLAVVAPLGYLLGASVGRSDLRSV